MFSRHRKTVRKFRKQLKLQNPLPSLYLWYQDHHRNQRYATAKKRILVVRHAHKNPGVYHLLLDWLAEELPETRAVFELRQLPCQIRDWSSYLLLVSWLPDPVQQWSPRAYKQTQQLTAACDEHEIPIINRVENLTNAVKSEGARRMGSVGIRTPKMAVIGDEAQFKETLLGLSLPLFVREDWGHGGNIYRVDTMDQVQQLNILDFTRPVAVEFIETQNPNDGLYRKYRYVAAGDEGVAASLHVRKFWMVHGSNCEFSDALRDEELTFLRQPDPNHEILQRARRALDLDFVAFDYSYDPDGQLVVWEANPHPIIHFSKGLRRYRIPAVQRTLAAMVKMYLKKSGMLIPSRLDEILSYPYDYCG